MKIDFNRPFLDYKGHPVVQNGIIQTMDEVIAQALFTGSTIRMTGNPEADGRTKLICFALSQRIYNSSGSVSITAEEATLIKQAVQGLNAGGYAQVINLIENNDGKP